MLLLLLIVSLLLAVIRKPVGYSKRRHSQTTTGMSAHVAVFRCNFSSHNLLVVNPLHGSAEAGHTKLLVWIEEDRVIYGEA